MWTSLNKKLYVILSIVLLIGIIVGIVFVVMLDEATKEIIFLNINEMLQGFSNIKINGIVMHILCLSCLVILSYLIIGAPLIIFFIFYNGFSIGFIISSITSIFGLKGLLYSIIYVIISKGIFLLILLVLSVNLLRIVKNMMEKIIYKNKGKDILISLGSKALMCIGIVLISDIILYFGGAKLINVFNFLLF